MKQPYSKLNAVEEGLQDQTEAELVPIAESTPRRPSIVKTVLTKETKQTVLGVGWNFTSKGAKGGGIKIWKIKEDSIAAATAPELREGMKLLRINKTDFQRSKSPNNVVSTLGNLDGDITIVAADDPSTFYATVSLDELKKTCGPTMKSSQLGIEFESISKHDIVIKFIYSSSSFAQQWKGEKPVVGDSVLMINDLDCTQGDLTIEDLNSKLDDMLLSDGSDLTIYFKKDETPVRPSMKNSPISNEVGSSSPPPGIQAGGVWGSNVHFGERTTIAACVCCLLCGWISSIIVCCNAFDKRRVYTVNQKVYDSTGALIGTEGNFQVEEGETHGRVDEGRMWMGLTIAGMVGFVFALLYVATMQQ